MTQIQHNQLVSFIWNIANDVLVNVYNKGDYRKVILPMIVLRRFDAVLEDTKKEVLAMKAYRQPISFNKTKHCVLLLDKHSATVLHLRSKI